MDKKSNIITVRLSDAQMERLDDLCKWSGITRSEVIQEMIDTQHDKINGNPKLREALAQLKAIQEQCLVLNQTLK